MKALRSRGVETIAPEAHAPLGLRKVRDVLRRLAGRHDVAVDERPRQREACVGNEVSRSPAGPKTISAQQRAVRLAGDLSAIRPTTMLSVFEYS